jgi:hypothetical protein
MIISKAYMHYIRNGYLSLSIICTRKSEYYHYLQIKLGDSRRLTNLQNSKRVLPDIYLSTL